MHFPTKGPANTDAAVRAAVARARELGIARIIVASNSGQTAEKLLAAKLPDFGLEIVCVTHQVGFARPGEDEMAPETRAKLAASGVKLLTTTHLLAGIDRAVRFKFQGLYPAEIVAAALRMLGQGVKVCAEIAGMACDAGLTPPGEDVVCIAGSGTGADTACVVSPAHSQHFFDLKIREIICKPRDF
ncbi:MAG: pyruvate kinase alpha/beta domain-containing protein [Bacillota bacterium]